MNLEAAKDAVDHMGSEKLADLAKHAHEGAFGGEATAGKTGDANPLGGMDAEKAKSALDSLGEKGVKEAKEALEAGDLKGAVAGAMENLGGGGAGAPK